MERLGVGGEGLRRLDEWAASRGDGAAEGIERLPGYREIHLLQSVVRRPVQGVRAVDARPPPGNGEPCSDDGAARLVVAARDTERAGAQAELRAGDRQGADQ